MMEVEEDVDQDTQQHRPLEERREVHAAHGVHRGTARQVRAPETTTSDLSITISWKESCGGD